MTHSVSVARRGRLVAAALAAAALFSLGATAACSPRSTGEPARDTGGGARQPSPPSAARGGAESDTGRIARLEREARALASVQGCASAGGCRTAPLGHRACGGPRDYVVYCAATTDSAALYRALDALARAEEEYQRKAGLASTCEFRMPPNVTASGGRCARAAGP